MIPIPLTTIIYDRGAGGAFTWQNPVSLAGRLTSYEDAIEARGGYKLLRVAFDCAPEELAEWIQAGLMRGVRSYTPTGRLRWEGVLVELKATIGPVSIVRSLDDMANRIIVSYGEAGGSGDNTSIYSDTASIAEYGTKDLQLNLSTTTAAGAAQRAQTDLKALAWPIASRETALDTATGGSVRIELRAVGRYDLLDWLLTTNTTTATAVTSTQAITLLTAFNAVNNWFSTSTAEITATGHSDTQYIEPYTSYQEKLEALLSQGTSTQTALAWGIYDDGVLRIAPWAGATPTVIGYYRHAADRTVRDPYGNVIPPWDWQPDVMAEDTAILGTTASDAAIASETREYIARVSLRIDSGGVSGTLEPEILGTTSPAAVAEAAANPVGRGAVGRSARQSKVERKIKKTTRTIHQSVDNPETPILTGGGGIDTGGGTITYPPPSGGPGSPTTGTSGSGTTGAITKWSNGPSGILGDATAGVDYVAPGSLNETIDDRVAALLVAGSGIGISYNDAGNTLTIATSGLDEIIDDEVAALLVAGTGISLSYNDAGNALTIATAGLNETIDDRVAALLVAGTGISLSYNDAGNALTISNTGGTVGGTGTAGRIPQWATGGADIENSTLIKSGAGLLTLSAAGAATLTIDSSIRLDGAGASAGQVLEWNGTAYAPATLAPADVAAAPDNAKYIVQQPSSGLSAEQALSALATGLLKNTTTTGVLSIAVAGTDYAAAIHTHAASDITSGVLSTARLGTGTANSTKYLAGDSTWQTLPSGVTGSAAATQVAYFSSAGAIAGNSALTFDVGAGDLFVSGVVNSNTHIEVLGTKIIGPRRTGWGGATGTATRTTFATSTVTLVQLAERMKALIDDLSTHGIIGG